MFCIKVCLFLVFLIVCEGEAEKDEIQDIAAVPTVLQISDSKQTNENDILQPVSGKNIKDLDNQLEKTNISNDIEVFKENRGPVKAKQEEEPAVEEESTTDDEEAKTEETEPGTQPDPANEEGAEPSPQTEDDAATAAAIANNEEAAAEAENLEPTATEEEKENLQPNDVTSVDEQPAGNDEAEMPNDEPAKGEEENEQSDLMEAVHTKDMDNKNVSCFACTSSEDVNCTIKATKEIKCPKTNEGDAGKHNGCYTLYQADTNTTMRGCVDDLAESGLKYCLTNDKLCYLCYSNGCNDKLAPGNAANLQLINYTLMILNISSFVLIKYASLKYYKF